MQPSISCSAETWAAHLLPSLPTPFLSPWCMSSSAFTFPTLILFFILSSSSLLSLFPFPSLPLSSCLSFLYVFFTVGLYVLSMSGVDLAQGPSLITSCVRRQWAAGALNAAGYLPLGGGDASSLTHHCDSMHTFHGTVGSQHGWADFVRYESAAASGEKHREHVRLKPGENHSQTITFWLLK